MNHIRGQGRETLLGENPRHLRLRKIGKICLLQRMSNRSIRRRLLPEPRPKPPVQSIPFACFTRPWATPGPAPVCLGPAPGQTRPGLARRPLRAGSRPGGGPGDALAGTAGADEARLTFGCFPVRGGRTTKKRGSGQEIRRRPGYRRCLRFEPHGRRNFAGIIPYVL